MGNPAEAEYGQAAVARAVDGAANNQGCGVALAKKTARMVRALMTSGERYREPIIA